MENPRLQEEINKMIKMERKERERKERERKERERSREVHSKKHRVKDKDGDKIRVIAREKRGEKRGGVEHGEDKRIGMATRLREYRHLPRESELPKDESLAGPSDLAMAGGSSKLPGSCGAAMVPAVTVEARAPICLRTRLDPVAAFEPSASTGNKSSQLSARPSKDSPRITNAARTFSDSVATLEAPASTGKKTSQLPARTPTDSPRKYHAVRLDNLSNKLKLKMTWADHQGGSFSSCCPVDVGVSTPSPCGPSSHPPSSSLAREELPNSRWRVVEALPTGKNPLNRSYKEALLSPSSHPVRSSSTSPKLRRHIPPPPPPPHLHQRSPARKCRCFRCLATDHLVRECRDPLRCWRCFKTGHHARRCRGGGSQRHPTMRRALHFRPPLLEGLRARV